MHERLTSRNPLGQRSHPATNQAAVEPSLGDDLGDERADATIHRMRLDGDCQRELRQHVSKIVSWCRMKVRDDDEPRLDPVISEAVGGDNGLAGHAPHANEDDIAAVTHDLHTVELEPTIESRDYSFDRPFRAESKWVRGRSSFAATPSVSADGLLER
jgi:hypothetical protein